MQRREPILSLFQRAAAQALGEREIRFRERKKKKLNVLTEDTLSPQMLDIAVGLVQYFYTPFDLLFDSGQWSSTSWLQMKWPREKGCDVCVCVCKVCVHTHKVFL